MTTSINRFSRILLCCSLLTGALIAQKRVKPGWNLFSAEQDVALGKQAAAEIEKQVTIVDDKDLTNYIARIGKRLADASPAPDYPYTFKVVADPNINAFALPGGPIYVHTGLLTAADNEAQMAGVLAHEVGHVALRHSTNRASKAQIFQIPLVLAGGALKQKGGILGAMSQIGIGFGLNSVFMKYSRSAEKDADIIGARMMADVGYDPIAMANFFQKLEAAGGGQGTPRFFASHPNPGNRVTYVSEEIQYLPKKNYTKGDTREFRNMKARAGRVKIPKPQSAEGQAAGDQATGGQATGVQTSGANQSAGTNLPAPPSAPAAGGNNRFTGAGFQIVHPAAWTPHNANDGMMVTILPQDGMVQTANGATGMARGMMAGYFEPRTKGLSGRTNELIASLQQSNPGLSAIDGKRTNTNLRGQLAQSVLLEGVSPLANQREIAWLITTERPQGVFYVLFVSPEPEYKQQSTAFQNILRSVTFQ